MYHRYKQHPIPIWLRADEGRSDDESGETVYRHQRTGDGSSTQSPRATEGIIERR